MVDWNCASGGSVFEVSGDANARLAVERQLTGALQRLRLHDHFRGA
jgi:uncharacterized protein YaiE (UPF0345 family)